MYKVFSLKNRGFPLKAEYLTCLSNILTLEDLPNELFLEIFRYLDSIDVLTAFEKLNNRFDLLLRTHVTKFDFRSISKVRFLHIMRSYDRSQWKSIALCDGVHTPGQIKFFFDIISTSEKFHLEQLSLTHMKQINLKEYFTAIDSFTTLVSLTIGPFCGLDVKPLHLPLLKRLVMQTCNDIRFLKNLINIEELVWIDANCCSHHDNWVLPRRLKKLKICFKSNRHDPMPDVLLNNIPCLTDLIWQSDADFSIEHEMFDGEFWENLIYLMLPNLNHFEFRCKFTNSSDEMIAASMRYFSMPFYCLEKRWYFQCLCNESYTMGIIYTLPFTGTELTSEFLTRPQIASTQPYVSAHELYKALWRNLRSIEYKTELLLKCPHLPTTNIRCVTLSDIDQLVVMPYFSHVEHLTIQNESTKLPEDFVSLWNTMKKLRSFSVKSRTLVSIISRLGNLDENQNIFRKIRSLTIGEHVSYNKCPNLDIQHLRVISLIFSENCENLSINLQGNLHQILSILKPMRKLQSLRLHYSPGYLPEEPELIPYYIDETESIWLNWNKNRVDRRNETSNFIWFESQR